MINNKFLQKILKKISITEYLLPLCIFISILFSNSELSYPNNKGKEDFDSFKKNLQDLIKNIRFEL